MLVRYSGFSACACYVHSAAVTTARPPDSAGGGRDRGAVRNRTDSPSDCCPWNSADIRHRNSSVSLQTLLDCRPRTALLAAFSASKRTVVGR